MDPSPITFSSSSSPDVNLKFFTFVIFYNLHRGWERLSDQRWHLSDPFLYFYQMGQRKCPDERTREKETPKFTKQCMPPRSR